MEKCFTKKEQKNANKKTLTHIVEAKKKKNEVFVKTVLVIFFRTTLHYK